MFGKQSMVNRMNAMEHTLNQPQPIETNRLDYSEKMFKMALDKYGSNDDSMAKETLVQIEKNRATKKSTASAEKTPHHKNWFNFFTGFFPRKQSVANNPMPFLSLS